MHDSPSPYVVNVQLKDQLHKETTEVVRMLREDPKNPGLADLSIGLLTKAVHDNLQFYFVKPAKDLDMGPIAYKALSMGASTVVKLTSTIGYKISKKSTPEQKARIADFIESTLLEQN